MPRKSVKRKVLIEIHDKIDIANEHSKKLKHVDGDFLDFERFQKNAELIEKDALLELGLQLVGPFEVLSFDRNIVVEDGQWVMHYRYFHDPPGFVTLIINKTEDFHIVILRRRESVVCSTMNNIGLVVKVDANDIGYRPLSVTYNKLNKYLEDVVNAQSKDDQLRKFDPICSLLTYSQFSNDEGDYGQSLELGLSMLAFHPKVRSLEEANVFNKDIKRLLCTGYKLAGDFKFADVIQKHMADRRLDPMTFTNVASE